MCGEKLDGYGIARRPAAGEALGLGPPACQAQCLEPIIRRDRLGPWLQLFTAKGFEWVDAQLPIPDLPEELDGFRLLHISDLHGAAAMGSRL